MFLFGLPYGGILSDIGFSRRKKLKAIHIIPKGSIVEMLAKDNCM